MINLKPKPNQLPLDQIPQWTLERMFKLQAFLGIPAAILIESALNQFLLPRWNMQEDCPKGDENESTS